MARLLELDRKLAASRQRIRRQLDRVREARLDGGDVALSLQVLRHLQGGYSDLVRIRDNLCHETGARRYASV
ncbi:hypothetical protein [Cupriavidus sp. D384]|uniref:hypothetical protein n=1 Tax=Cupriavidus sp. D384 TaxID=1538095 RepID=UPI00082F8D0F|nr:hypothetical protein [Cupriavidus sp. D384]